MQNKEIIIAIKSLCGSVGTISNLGYHFVYKSYRFLFIPSEMEGMLRFSIPHIEESKKYDSSAVCVVVNKVNLEVKYAKAVIRDQGSISVEYDYKISSDEDLKATLPHIVDTLAFAAKYLTEALGKI